MGLDDPVRTRSNAVLVTLADSTYIDQAKQLFSSAYWNAGWNGDYLLLAHDIDRNDLAWFSERGIRVKECTALSDTGWGTWSPVLLDKFYLFTEPFKEWQNVVFVEADIIIRSSLEELSRVEGFWATSAGDYARVRDLFHAHENTERLASTCALDTPSFNNGVLAFSTDTIREDTFSELVRLFSEHRSIAQNGEESIMNLHFCERWNTLPLAYNTWPAYLDEFYRMPSRSIDAICMHFIRLDQVAPEKSTLPQHEKPWKRASPFFSEWLVNRFRAESIRLDEIPSGRRPDWRRLHRIESTAKRRAKHVVLKRDAQLAWRTRYDRALSFAGSTLRSVSPRLHGILRRKRSQGGNDHHESR